MLLENSLDGNELKVLKRLQEKELKLQEIEKMKSLTHGFKLGLSLALEAAK